MTGRILFLDDRLPLCYDKAFLSDGGTPMKTFKRSADCLAVLAALFYALNAPLSKLLLQDVPPGMMAALLYLGAGLGMLLLSPVRRASGKEADSGFSRHDMPYVAGMIALDIAAPLCLMWGLRTTSPASVSLLNNFEIAATSIIALVIFHEAISRRLWCAIGLVTLASVLLSLDSPASVTFSPGSLLVLGACVCWGFENNCTRMLSHGDPLRIVIIKGLGSGLGALLVALLSGEALPGMDKIPLVLLLGFVSYGLSVYCYVRAQRTLGAARTSAYYAIAPFAGVAISFLLFREMPGMTFLLALPLMLLGTRLTAREG